MSEIDDIASETIQTEEDLISGDFCICGHKISEHFMDKCGGLDFNGTVWSGCSCRQTRVIPFEIKFYVEIDEDRDTNNTTFPYRKVA